MPLRKATKSRFQPIFDYMDERFEKIEADIAFIRERLDLCIANMDKSEQRWQTSNRQWELNNQRWELNDRRFNRQMELLENHHNRISVFENK